ncbi:hypothetical protein C2S52_013642 [Perilla frutescens var. hirtella]|nr:hypothetical protein C2S52_013642 [Perilla frutescens var. hirtella]
MEPPRIDELKEEEVQKPSNRINEDEMNLNENKWEEDCDEADILKDLGLYLAAKTGNLAEFQRILDRVSAADHASFDEILSRCSPAGNAFLHVAAKHGNKDLAIFIAAQKPSLWLYKNSNGETVLHSAAKAGDASMVKALVEIYSQFLLPNDEVDESFNLLREKNERGNTVLHEALLNGWDSVAGYLIKEDPELSYCRNKDGESGLYLAAQAGFVDCVSLILRLCTDLKRFDELFKKKSPILAAIKNKDVLEAMLDINPSLIRSRDDEGRNPLHYAALSGHHRISHYLLSLYTGNASRRDKNGQFPIHLAAIEGHVDVVRLLLEYLPDPEELLDRDGRNILHLAANHGRSNVVGFILKNPNLCGLINMKDKCGNTPLHLATMCFHPTIVSALTWNKRADVKLVNDDGMTALDVADYYYKPDNSLSCQLLTLAALRAASTPRSVSGKFASEKKMRIVDLFRDRVSILLIVSTLIATVTFAAGFTIPGCYNNAESDSDSGMVKVLREKAFHVFIFCDIVAMYSSIVVAVFLMWAQVGDFIVMLNALYLALPFFGISLTMMSIAFTAGVFLVVSKLRWLSTVVLAMGVSFLLILIILILPLVFPITSSNRLWRCLSYYPFCLLVLVIKRQITPN